MKQIHSYLLIFILSFTQQGCTDESNLFLERTSSKPFDDVIQDAEFAITENNFRITHRLHIGDAIQERGNTDFPRNEVILFCNLTLAEEMLLIDSRSIHYCPYKLTVTESKNQVIIGTMRIPINSDDNRMNAFANNINKTLDLIVQYAASDDPFILDQHNDDEIK